MTFPIFDFVSACILMGLGIGADVAIATLIRGQQLQTPRTVVFWILGVSLTHTLFPMAGYLLTYFSIQVSPAVTPLVGLVAFTCIAHFLFSEFREYSGITTTDKSNAPDHSQIMITLGLILAVSWDALWSGPAKSAQVIGWPELMIWLSFIVVGMIVASCALFGLRAARRLQALASQVVYQRSFGWIRFIGLLTQYSIVAYFGWLALLRYTLDVDMIWWQLLLTSVMSTLIIAEAIQLRKKLAMGEQFE